MPETAETNATDLPATRDFALVRAILWGCFLGLSLAVTLEVCRMVFFGNFHTVLPGRVYRCGQQTGSELLERIEANGIKTVINLRGSCDLWPWYVEECRATHQVGVAQEDVCLSACRYPSIPEMRHLVEILDRTAYPILIHCRHGADRTGLASTVALLLQTNASLSEARKQMTLRYGHVDIGRTANLDRFLDIYGDWLKIRGLSHSGANFRQWLAEDDCPGEYHCIMEPLRIPRRIRINEPFVMRVRVRNTSSAAWRFRPESNAGIHAYFLIHDTKETCHVYGRAGLFNEQVLPGQSIDLNLAVPHLPHPGRYHVQVDMVDEAHCSFFQVGSEPLERDIFVERAR